MYKILLDTNMFLAPAHFGIDIFSEIDRICEFNYELCIIDKIEFELEKIIKEQKGKEKEAAKLGLSLLKTQNIKRITTKDSKKDVDSLILGLSSSEKGYIVATLDKELRERLRKVNVPVIYLRSNTHLKLEKHT